MSLGVKGKMVDNNLEKKNLLPSNSLYYQAAFSPCFFYLADFHKSPAPPASRTPWYFANSGRSIQHGAGAGSRLSPSGLTVDAEHCGAGQCPGFACLPQGMPPSLSPCSAVTRITVSSGFSFIVHDALTRTDLPVPVLGPRSSPIARLRRHERWRCPRWC